MSKITKFIKRRKYISGGLALLLIIIIGGIVWSSNGVVETVSPVKGDLIREVEISGKVIPKESADLSFEISGTVSGVLKKVGDIVRRGDTITRINSAGISSDILRAEAELKLAEANLTKLEGAGVYEAEINNSKRTLIQTIVDAYTAVDDAVYNKTDKLFLDPRTAWAQFTYDLSDEYLRNSVNQDRVKIGGMLEDWKLMITGLNTSNYTEAKLEISKGYLSSSSSYISNVVRAITSTESSSFLSQSTLDGYKADAASARASLNQAAQDLISAEDSYRSLVLEVPVQVARVESARATLANYRSELSKTVIVSPIEGVVSKQDAKLGQVATQGEILVSIVSQTLELEAFIPEVLISEVSLNNEASITLDAYGEEKTFLGKVVHIDPAETLRDGVSSYKVRLLLDNTDRKAKPGMSANISIETFKKPNVTMIPERTVIKEDGKTFVYVLNGENEEKIEVSIGERDSSGNVELLSNLREDTKLIVNP